MNTVPDSGGRTPAASWALAKARAKSSSSPITSLVDRISGPGATSTAGKRANGKTASLTATRPLRPPCFPPIRSRSFATAMTRAAMAAMDRPVALATKGTGRLARGLTSRT